MPADRPAPRHYCDSAPGHPLHGPYHDNEYGFPARDEAVLFERLTLEIMQAGLSWEIVLKKRAALALAFDHYDVAKIAAYGEKDVVRLMADSGIIRNRRKIAALIENAKRVLALRAVHGGFADWLAAQGDLSRKAWEKLFKTTFVFMGPEIVGEFLTSLGVLEGAHKEGCPILVKIKAIKTN